MLKYIFLGFIQGITEPIPVSSSGHLVIFKSLLNDNVLNDLNFEIIVNFGSLIAILILFRKDIIAIIHDFFLYIKTKEDKYYSNFRYAWLIVIGSVPAGIAGLLLKDKIESILSGVKIVGCALLITALFLYLVKDYEGKKDDDRISVVDALIIGFFQVLALFPGISRSGSTLVGGMRQGLKRENAFKFSFMLYIPISFATMFLGVKDLVETSIPLTTWIYYGIGAIVSGIITYFSTKWFKNIVQKGKLIYFVWYCLIVGVLVILFV
jgi:undecaprenyl-diphosphatase